MQPVSTGLVHWTGHQRLPRLMRICDTDRDILSPRAQALPHYDQTSGPNSGRMRGFQLQP